MFFRVIVMFVLVSAQLFSQNLFLPSKVTPNRSLQFTGQISNSDSLVNLIVEFKESPLFLAQKNNLMVQSSAAYQDRFVRFDNDVHAMTSQTLSKGSATKIEIGRKFYKAFYGVSLRISQKMIPFIEQFSYVKKVHSDFEVKATLAKSIPQIRVNEVWNTFNVKGDGVVVGIIDSGIDYLHPALGGGIGASFKVIGGYDFVNNDNDPMDDHGHGTHVAGIVAADGVDIQGVAPKAKLFGLKVLNAQGRGNESDIIAAIERSVDPNQDGDMSDKLDVVNMSLGSYYGNADDAECTAIDQATQLGVTFVIAAGNDGRYSIYEGKEDNYYYTGMESIGSPASARSAITVGAIDSVNKIADFSSKGPSRIYYDIKPDVSAPGVNIRSLVPGNAYGIKSGTSMASPMVAGVAALIKSKNKNLTPQQIKSAIINSSVDLGFKTTLQGAGKVDAMRATSNTSFVQPTQLSFGLDNPAQPTWTKIETVFVTNTKNGTQNYSVGFSTTSAGITFSASPNNFSLAQGLSQQVLITIAVNNAVVPIVDEDIILYDGFAHIRGSSDTLHLPWLFARTTRMLLTFNETNPTFVGTSDKYYIVPFYNSFYSKVRWLDDKTMEVSGASPSNYDFAVFFRNSSKLVLKSNLQFTGAESFSFNSAEAVHPLNFKGVDQNGVPLSLAKTQRVLRVDLPLGWLFAPLLDGVKTVFVSPASAQFSFLGYEAMIDLTGEKRVVLPQYSRFSGISGEVNLSNNAGAFYKQTLQFRVPENFTSTRIFTEVFATQLQAGEGYGNTIIVGTDTVNVPNKIATFDLYMMKQSDTTYGATVAFHTNSSYATDGVLDMSTRFFNIFNDSIMLGFPAQSDWLTTFKSANGDTMLFGESPIYLMNLSYNNSSDISIHFNTLFFGSLFEQRFTDLNSGKYTIYNEAGQKLKEDGLNVFPRSPFVVDPGKYRLQIEAEGYGVSNTKGKLTLINNVDLTKPIPDAPMITSFMIVNSRKKPSNNLLKNEQGLLRFSAKTLAGPSQVPVADSTKVYYRKYKTSPWISLLISIVSSNVEREGTIFSVPLSPATTLDTAAIDLKIRLADANGNSVEQILSPAFSVGNWIDDGSTQVEEEPFVPKQFGLYQNFPNPFNPTTTINYQLPDPSRVTIVVYNMLGQEVRTLVNKEQLAGYYSIVWNGRDNSNLKVSSGVYIYRIEAIGSHNNRFSEVKKMVMLK